jgi:hypothetical protein
MAEEKVEPVVAPPSDPAPLHVPKDEAVLPVPSSDSKEEEKAPEARPRPEREATFKDFIVCLS